MALFRRNKTTSVLPEVDQYYTGERRDRAGIAWLLALVSVALVALVLVGAFLAGRWAYREITDNGRDEVAVVETDEQLPSFDGGEDEDAADDNDTDTEDTETEGTVDAPARTDTPSTPPSTPVTGAEELPYTGPGSLAASFVAVSAAAAGAHNLVSRRKNRA